MPISNRFQVELFANGHFEWCKVMPHCTFDLHVSNNSPGEDNGTPLQYFAWKIPWVEEPGGLQSMGSLRVGHDWATSLSLFTFMHWRRKWQPAPVFLPGESQGRGSLVAAVYGVSQSRTRLKRLSSSSSSSIPLTNTTAEVLCTCMKWKGHQLAFSDLISCLQKTLSGKKLLMRVSSNFNLEVIGRKWAQNS